MDQTMKKNDYTAILLAAGYGSRIAGLTDRPKCLLEIEGKTLLSHHLETWIRLGIPRAHLVLGYAHEMVKVEAEKYQKQIEISYSYNNDYKTKGNTFSLWCGLREVSGAILIFDADLLYEDSILENFLKDPNPSQILVGSGLIDDIECAKVLIDARGLVRKTVDKRAINEEELKSYRFLGEAMGILKFSGKDTQALLTEASDFLENPNNILLNWEHLLNVFLPKREVSAHFNPSEKWIEIDTPEDFNEALKIFKGLRP